MTSVFVEFSVVEKYRFRFEQRLSPVESRMLTQLWLAVRHQLYNSEGGTEFQQCREALVYFTSFVPQCVFFNENYVYM